MGSERREHTRVSARLVIRFGNPKTFLKSYTENLSKGGLFIASDHPHPMDTKLQIVLHLPEGLGEIELAGRVVHVWDDANGARRGMGVEFTTLTAETRQLLHGYADRLMADEKVKDSGDDRREHRRLPAKLVVRFASPKAFLQQYTENISKGGLFIQMEKPHSKGTPVKIELHLPMTKRALDLEGKVAHIRGKEDGLSSGIGVEFADLAEETRRLIDAYVAALIEKQAKGRL